MAKRAKKTEPPRYFIVKLETFEGRDTACYVLGTDPMWIVVAASPTRGASIVDWGYRSLQEAGTAWPEAVAPAGEPRARRGAVGTNRVPPVVAEPWFQGLWKRSQSLR